MLAQPAEATTPRKLEFQVSEADDVGSAMRTVEKGLAGLSRALGRPQQGAGSTITMHKNALAQKSETDRLDRLERLQAVQQRELSRVQFEVQEAETTALAALHETEKKHMSIWDRIGALETSVVELKNDKAALQAQVAELLAAQQRAISGAQASFSGRAQGEVMRHTYAGGQGNRQQGAPAAGPGPGQHTGSNAMHHNRTHPPMVNNSTRGNTQPMTHGCPPQPDSLYQALVYERNKFSTTFKLDNMVTFKDGEDRPALQARAQQVIGHMGTGMGVVVEHASWSRPMRQGEAPSRLIVRVRKEDTWVMEGLKHSRYLAQNQRVTEELGPVELAMARVTRAELQEWWRNHPGKHISLMSRFMDRAAMHSRYGGEQSKQEPFSAQAIAAGMAKLGQILQQQHQRYQQGNAAMNQSA